MAGPWPGAAAEEPERTGRGAVLPSGAMSGEPKVAVLMGSTSDLGTMQHCLDTLAGLDIAHEARALSAHRTPDALKEYVEGAEARGVRVFIAAAGGAAHLAGVVAAHTDRPVLGVPIESPSLKGLDSLLAMVQMPAGVPVGTLAIGKAGAINAALLAAQILGTEDPKVRAAVQNYRRRRRDKVLQSAELSTGGSSEEG